MVNTIVICPNCGKNTPEGKFCESCGARVDVLSSCRACGAPLAPGSKFCENCSSPVGSAGAAPPAAVPVAPYQTPIPLAPEGIHERYVPITPAPAPASGNKSMIVGGIVGIIILAIIVFLVVLPMLSDTGSSGSGTYISGSSGSLPQTVTPTSKSCETLIFDTPSIAAMKNNPPNQRTVTLSTSTYISKIGTYHWNNGKGFTPGSISLKDQNGKIYGPWYATGSTGQGGVQNAFWSADVKATLPAGKYTVVDSDPSSWSYNSETGNAGVVMIYSLTACNSGSTVQVTTVSLSPTFTPTSKSCETLIFETPSIAAVKNNPTTQRTITLSAPTYITKIGTYHWNNGKGFTPGSISLKDQSGKIYGPWYATGSPGQGGVQNAYWYATVKATLPAGKYTVVDSDPSSWSYNSETGNAGMVMIYSLTACNTG